MPASFLSRHRTICAVLEEIRTNARAFKIAGADGSADIEQLVDEAKTYAEAMSAKLTEYKNEKMEKQTKHKSERYKVIESSKSAHCCFVATVVDTTKPDMCDDIVCECFDIEQAHLIVKALNGQA